MLREIPDDGVAKLLSNKDYLASCDVALFVYDRWVGKAFSVISKNLMKHDIYCLVYVIFVGSSPYSLEFLQIDSTLH